MSRADRRTRLQLVLGGLRWRAGATTSMALVATVAVAAGTFGPIYLSEADHSVLLTTLRAAPSGNTGIELIPSGGRNSRNRLLRAANEASRAFGTQSFFGPPIVTEDVAVTTVSTTTGQLFGSDLVARTDACRHLSFSSGGCPVAGGSVAVSTRSARALGLHTGDHLLLSAPRSRQPITLEISGLFRPGSVQAAFWWQTNYFPYGTGSTTRPLIDDVFASQSTVLTVAPPRQLSLVAERPLIPDALAPGGVSAFETWLSRYEHASRTLDGVGVSSQVVTLLDGAAHEEHTTGTIVIVVDLQLVLLSLLVLYFVAARTAEAREPDVRLAELRGFARSDAAVIALLEPVVVLGLAVPVGVGLAWLAARLAGPHLFVPGITPSLGLLALGAAILSFVAGVMATFLGARQLIVRRIAPPRAARNRFAIAVAVDTVAVALAGVAFVEVAAAGVSSGSHTDPLAAFAPGLLAFGVGVLGARLLPVIARLAFPATRHSRWVATTLAVRRVARRPELSRHIVLLALAIGLATFAISGWAVARQNRSIRAGFDVGASQVLIVQARPGVDFLTAVRRADPGGSRAMAVVIERAPDGVLMAVDSPRLAEVASWPPTLSTRTPRSIAQLLTPRTAPVVTVVGAALRVSADLVHAVVPAPELVASVFDNSFQTLTTVDLGPLQVGSHTYEASLAGGCAPSCRLVDLAVIWNPPGADPQQNVDVALRVSSVSDEAVGGSWSVVHAGLGDPRAWGTGSGGVRIGHGPAGLTVDATVDADGAPAAFGPADVPSVLPAVVTGPGTAAVGLDGATITVRPVSSVMALPVIGNDNGAVMVDLALAERLQSGPVAGATSEVWLAPGGDGGLVSRLDRLGVHVVGVRSSASRISVLSQSGASLAYDLFLLAAIVAAVLAVGSTMFTVAVTARRRTVELASLGSVGVGRRSLRRSLVLEQSLVLLVGAAAGTLAGVIAAVVALPSIPEDFAPGPGPSLAFGLPWAAVGVIVLAVTVALGITVALASRLVVDRASADKLGGDQ